MTGRRVAGQRGLDAIVERTSVRGWHAVSIVFYLGW